MVTSLRRDDRVMSVDLERFGRGERTELMCGFLSGGLIGSIGGRKAEKGEEGLDEWGFYGSKKKKTGVFRGWRVRKRGREREGEGEGEGEGDKKSVIGLGLERQSLESEMLKEIVDEMLDEMVDEVLNEMADEMADEMVDEMLNEMLNEMG
jgi:hypothetical protein